jgi:hypothetical protein
MSLSEADLIAKFGVAEPILSSKKALSGFVSEWKKEYVKQKGRSSEHSLMSESLKQYFLNRK